MNTRVDDFFNCNAHILHNKDALPIPYEYEDWKNNEDIMVEFFKWIRFKSRCASLRLNVDSDITDVKEEIVKRSFLAVPHRSSESNGWKSITLHGLSSIMTEPAEYYKDELGIVEQSVQHTWTDVSKFFPETVKWIQKNVPIDNYARVRIMVLESGGYIEPHSDTNIGQILGGAGVNIAITNPEGCEFCLEDSGLIPWKEGDVRMVDVHRYHSVRNKSPFQRIHIIIHTDNLIWNKSSIRLVCESYEKFQKR